MQDLGAVTYDDLKAPVQELLYKFEAWDGAAWIDLCALGGLNYLVDDSLSFSSGGAGVSPDPIAGTWSATIDNKDGIFHPRHPTSIYSGLLCAGRKVRISVGATYNATPRYFQRLVGYMDPPRFQEATKTVEVSGGDSMKALADTKLASPNTFWGAMETFSSVLSTDVLGSELYTQNDAAKNSPSDFDTMANWSTLSHAAIASVDDDEGSGDLGGYNAELTKNASGYATGWAAHETPFSVTVGKLYKVSFWYKRVSAGCTFSIRAYETASLNLMGKSAELSSTSWGPASFYFTATKTSAVRLSSVITGSGTGLVCRFDLVTVKEVTAYYNTRYNMPAASHGVYFVTLDDVPLWYGDTSQGWLYDPILQVFYFDENTHIVTGTNNLKVYYFTTQDIIDVLGDVLAATPLYADRAAALAALVYTDPVVTVPKVWFEAGTSALEAVKRICERCNYRFWLDELDVPRFQPAPTHGDPVAWFASRAKADGGDFQDIEEVRNSIVIEGMERGAFSTAKDKQTSRITGLANDGPFSADKLERTHSITNDLFQDQATTDAMAATLLAEFKDPKLYSDLPVPKNPIPLQRGDTVEWDIDLRVASGADAGLKNTVRGIIRDVSFAGDEFNYKCEMRSQAMNIANYATGPVTVTAEYCKGWGLTNAGASGDVQFNLPAATVGMEITFYVLAAQTLTINPNGTERIAVITGTAGDYLRSDNVIGSCIKLACFVAGYWHKIGVAVGTWAEE
jgi:hypothetical protein